MLMAKLSRALIQGETFPFHLVNKKKKKKKGKNAETVVFV